MLIFPFPSHTIPYFICLVAFIVFEISIRLYKRSIQKTYRHKKELIHSSEEAESTSLDYFSKLQTADITKIVFYVVFFVIILFIADVRSYSFLAVTIGAFIISIRAYLLSLIAYLYILANFTIGDDIKVESVLGEIVSIRPLTTSVAGKDEHGDFDGGLHHIPNSKFIKEIVERQEIKNNTYRRVTLQVLYSQESFEQKFSVWLPNLKNYLDKTLTKRSLKDVGNYKSYSGIRYKIHYDYNDDGEIVVSISFISRTKNAAMRKEEVIGHIETTRREYSSTQ